MTDPEILRDPLSGASVPEAMAPFVEVLGIEGAVHLCMAVGGRRINVPLNPSAADDLVRLAGMDVAEKLSARMAGERVAVPFPRAFLIRYFRARGWTVPAMAGALKCSERNVYRVLAGAPAWSRAG